jgi:photosystem II stability/assembly factor-like uncharacterized protein
VGGHFALFTSDDGGRSWQRRESPAALEDEGAFAASGTCLTAKGSSAAWFGTGGPGGARVFHSTDRGRSWSVSKTAIRNDSNSAGIFSVAFSDPSHGEAVGGDYTKPNEARATTAITSDGGRTWHSQPRSDATGFRSAALFIPGMKQTLVAVGSSGSDVSQDNGQSWRPFSSNGFNAVSAAPDGSVWAAGPHGTIAKLTISVAR